MTNDEIQAARRLIAKCGPPEGLYAEKVMEVLTLLLDDLEDAHVRIRDLHDALEWTARSLNAIGQSKGLVADHGDALDRALSLLCGCTVGSHFKDCQYGFVNQTKDDRCVHCSWIGKKLYKYCREHAPNSNQER